MPVVTLSDVSISYGVSPLLERASVQIDAGERVCLIGRNGAGKSTLLQIVAGSVTPDSGEVWRKPGLRIGRLSQELPAEAKATVFDVVARGLAEVGQLLAEFQRTSRSVTDDPRQLPRLEALQQQIDTCDGWSLSRRVAQILKQLDLDPGARVRALSGGWQRRVALAEALVSEPDLLLLDEPTNHLDIDVIQWLEKQLLERRGAVLFVTHDRALLSRLATRIVELDRGVLTSWSCDHATFLERKAAALEEEERQAALLDKRLAQEEAWLRQGIKARRTRNEGRVRALLALRKQRAQRRDVEGAARMTVDAGSLSGRLVAEAVDVSFAWSSGAAPVVRDLSLRILRGDRIGIVGPNGAGKTTLLRLLLGSLEPTSGVVRQGTRLEVAYYDQLRAVLDPEKTLIENLAEGREYVDVQGERRHVMGYLQDFLFSRERARTPVKVLSGGERNRVVLARLFAQPANLLVLDEPTNDLDLETLELLEHLLMAYSGTLLLVSHDRAFLDNVVTSTLVFEGDGRVQEYLGGYTDGMRRRREAAAADTPSKTTTPKAARAEARLRPAKLGFNEQRELEQAPARIEALEAEQSELAARLNEPEFYRGDPADQTRVHARLASLASELDALYTRWYELETLRGNR